MTDGPGPSSNPLSDPEFVAGLRAVPSGLADESPSWEASDLTGTRPDGTSVTVGLDSVDRPLLLVFLSLDCDGCDTFWSGLSEGSDPVLADVETVVVTKGPDRVSVDEVAALARRMPRTTVVMGDAAWTDYRVTGYPFLVVVDPASRRILAEAVGFGWSDVAATIAAGLH